MQGSPIRAFFLVLLALLVLAVPLWVLTSHPTQAQLPVATSDSSQSTETRLCLITIRFAHLPQSWSLKVGDTILQESIHPDQFEYLLATDIPASAESVRFDIEATWEGVAQRTPVTISIEPEGDESLTETKWSVDGKIHDVVEYHSHRTATH
jgi:hypothetical protein